MPKKGEVEKRELKPKRSRGGEGREKGRLLTNGKKKGKKGAATAVGINLGHNSDH